jgi:AcrR family transcriptional regulator
MDAGISVPERQRTFTETARRAQIVEAAIQTINEVGYARTSFAKIAAQAGLSSTGVISYHFADKGDLIAEVVAQVYGAMGECMSTQMVEAASPSDALRTYIESSIGYIGTHWVEVKATLEIFMGGGMSWDASSEESVVSPIEGILRAGQASGEFRPFDPKVMATVIQRAIDGLPFLFAADAGLDAGSYATEIVTLFTLATRASD